MTRALLNSPELEVILEDMARTFSSSWVGIDGFLGRLSHHRGTTYPPYNITKEGEDQYTISVAVAGFDKDSIDIRLKDSILTIASVMSDSNNDETPSSKVIHQGIAKRRFELTFGLDNYIEAERDATLVNGMLNVYLVRNIPENKRARTIPIQTSA